MTKIVKYSLQNMREFKKGEKTMKRFRLKIEGMGCEGCARKIAWFLEQSGATNVSVSRQSGEALFNIDEKDTVHRFVEVVEKAGHYHVTSVEEIVL